MCILGRPLSKSVDVGHKTPANQLETTYTAEKAQTKNIFHERMRYKITNNLLTWIVLFKATK